MNGPCRVWLQQARRDLDAAAFVAKSFPEWACYMCQQAAEKAIKAARMATGTPADQLKTLAKGHGLTPLLGDLAKVRPPEHQRFEEAIDLLDGYGNGTRYPVPIGDALAAPMSRYTVHAAETAVELATCVVEYAEKFCADLETFWGTGDKPPGS